MGESEDIASSFLFRACISMSHFWGKEINNKCNKYANCMNLLSHTSQQLSSFSIEGAP